MNEVVDLRDEFGRTLSGGAIATFGRLQMAWKAAGSPRDVGLSLKQAVALRDVCAPGILRQLDVDTLEAPFMRIHVLGRDDAED